MIETGQKKRCKNGHTIVYRLILAKVNPMINLSASHRISGVIN